MQIDRARSAREVLGSQEVILTIDNNRYPISNPQNELYVTLMQNGRWDNLQDNIQPKFAVGNVINFDLTRRPSFRALTEFRGVDLRSLNTRGYGIYSIDVYEDEIDVLLEMDAKRGNILIQTIDDLNGDFIIETLDYNFDDPIRSEYVNTFFTLGVNHQVLDGDVYLVGSFTDWEAREEFRLSYDPLKQVYTAGVLLKQGYYDYQYMILHDDGTMDCSYFEGSHYGTSNQYHALVYQRSLGKRYDRLIGVATTTSNF